MPDEKAKQHALEWTAMATDIIRKSFLEDIGKRAQSAEMDKRKDTGLAAIAEFEKAINNLTNAGHGASVVVMGDLYFGMMSALVERSRHLDQVQDQVKSFVGRKDVN